MYETSPIQEQKRCPSKSQNMNQTMPWMKQEEKKKSHDPGRER
jgi:hypothetical protein